LKLVILQTDFKVNLIMQQASAAAATSSTSPCKACKVYCLSTLVVNFFNLTQHCSCCCSVRGSFLLLFSVEKVIFTRLACLLVVAVAEREKLSL